jgi:hypothetical protein
MNHAIVTDDRAHLEALLTALNASPLAMRRDECGDRSITGKSGHIFADGLGYPLYVRGESARHWGFVKKRLAFCRLNQDGDDEGCLHLDHLPTPAEAALIREALGIGRKRRMTPDALASLERARKSVGRPHQPPAFAKSLVAALQGADTHPARSC